jgi:hypothetical protein
MKNETNCIIQTAPFLLLAVLVLLSSVQTVEASEEGWTKLRVDAWHNSDKWDVIGGAMLIVLRSIITYFQQSVSKIQSLPYIKLLSEYADGWL